MLILKKGKWKLKKGLFTKNTVNIGIIKLKEWKGISNYEMEFLFLGESEDYVYGLKNPKLENSFIPIKIDKNLIM